MRHGVWLAFVGAVVGLGEVRGQAQVPCHAPLVAVQKPKQVQQHYAQNQYVNQQQFYQPTQKIEAVQYNQAVYRQGNAYQPVDVLIPAFDKEYSFARGYESYTSGFGLGAGYAGRHPSLDKELRDDIRALTLAVEKQAETINKLLGANAPQPKPELSAAERGKSLFLYGNDTGQSNPQTANRACAHCHTGEHEGRPMFVEGRAIVDLDQGATPLRERIYRAAKLGSMPPSKPLTDEELRDFGAWLYPDGDLPQE